MSIIQLPEEVANKLHSSVHITSLNSVACHLIENSLDAGATKINLYIDHARGNCTVEDNGVGIPGGEFLPEGGLGKLHHTSKFPAQHGLHGRHGNFLASLATLSLLSITSRQRQHASHSSMTIHNGVVLQRQLPAHPEQRFLVYDHGTRVAVRDLFGSMPVRVKQRAVLASAKPSMDREWNNLVHEIVSVLLAWSSDVTVLLKDTKAQRELRLRSDPTSESRLRILRLLSQASLVDNTEVGLWESVSASARDFTVKGYISRTPVSTRRTQFLSLGIHPVSNDFGTNMLYEEINRVFANSEFGWPIEGEGKPAEPSDQPEASKRARKGLERWPMFFLQIVQPSSADPQLADYILEHQQPDVAVILDLLRAVCYGFLRKHLCRPQKVQLSSNSAFSVSTKRGRSSQSKRLHKDPVTRDTLSSRQQVRSTGPFDGWHLVKSGRPTFPSALKESNIQGTDHSNKRMTPLVGDGGKLLRMPFEANDASEGENLEAQPLRDLDERWTGQSVREENAHESDQSNVVLEAEAQPLQQRPKRRVLEQRPKQPPSEWLQSLVQSWKNPVFENVEAPIHQAHDDSCRSLEEHSGCSMLAPGSLELDGRLSRSALANATVISQVDGKFILVKMPLHKPAKQEQPPSSTLVMVDQHAADERCQLEMLMNDYFETCPATGQIVPTATALDPPRVYEVPFTEGEKFEQLQKHFEAWGIVYRLQPAKHSGVVKSLPRQLVISALPPSIIERCRTEPRLLIDIMRRELARYEDGTLAVYSASPHRIPGKHWTSHFHGCPQGILDLLYSRSCRSAIMFNDVLSKAECEQLISRLSKCVFPFQCAHGRPSMAPLIDLGSNMGIKGWTE
ncbi:hypothetical protein B0I35DRAFT_459557 [Stachybotrys elegans]|uniref:MutL C-terminal dimerisation domain-containing protein n=1 Tax=Stachybotrys elegans TaxID=80388 RepID=A0A8K0WSH3_9HYPO|nr:hypothetical protein B0I35DRAFT_459557 [Stachybotrys elegans]